jgi:hypothetical protein
MIGHYGSIQTLGSYGAKSPDESNGYLDCEGISGAVFWPYCLPKKILTRAADAGSSFVRTLLLTGIIVSVAVFGIGAAYLGLRGKGRKLRSNGRTKMKFIERAFRVVAGLGMTGLGAVGWLGPQAAEPLSTVIGLPVSAGGLYLTVSGLLSPAKAKSLRKEITG